MLLMYNIRLGVVGFWMPQGVEYLMPVVVYNFDGVTQGAN